MKLIYILSILMMQFGLVQYGVSQSRHEKFADLEGMERFWNILDIIKSGNLPTQSDWNKLFSTKAYSYLAQESGSEQIKTRFMLAFAPSRSNERKEILAKGDYQSRIIDHLNKADFNRQAIMHFLDSIRNVPILENSLKLTANYLPRGFIEDHKELSPLIAFAIFEPDGKANNEIIVIDASFAMGIDLNLFLAHEAHHFFMGKIRKSMRPANDQIEYVLRTLRQLHLEGIADLIDKRGILKMPETLTEDENWYAYHYRNYYNSARTTFARIDGLLQEISDSNTNEEAGSEIWNSLHFGTHPEALHIARLIEDTFGISHIIGVLDNPFEFFRSYQKASKLNPSNGWNFSTKSMAFLAELESHYLID